jgi:hypothetical protein
MDISYGSESKALALRETGKPEGLSYITQDLRGEQVFFLERWEIVIMILF